MVALRVRFLSWFLVACLACACSHTLSWQPQRHAPCVQGTGVGELERERTYLSALLALHDRQYGVVYAEPNHQIEAVYASGYKPEEGPAHWVLSVLDDASLVVDTPSNTREVHKRALGWYKRLSVSIAQYQCRELDWLRWQAQNRGLVPIGPAPVELGEAPPPSSGAESPPDTAERKRQLKGLTKARSELVLNRPIAFSATGLGLLVGGVSMLPGAIIGYGDNTCEEGFEGSHECDARELSRKLILAGSAIGAVGAAVLATSLPILLGRLKRMRALNREIKLLRTRLELAPHAAEVRVLFGATF